MSHGLQSSFARCGSLHDALMMVNAHGLSSGTIKISSPDVHGWVMFRGRSVVRAGIVEQRLNGRAALQKIIAVQDGTFAYLPVDVEAGADQENTASSLVAPLKDKIVMRDGGEVIVFLLPTFADLSETLAESAPSSEVEATNRKFTDLDESLQAAGFNFVAPMSNSAVSRALIAEPAPDTPSTPLVKTLSLVMVAVVAIGVVLAATVFRPAANDDAKQPEQTNAVQTAGAATEPAGGAASSASNNSGNPATPPQTKIDPADALEAQWNADRKNAGVLEKLVRLLMSRRDFRKARTFAAMGFLSPAFTQEQRAMFYQLYGHCLKIT